MAGCEWYGPSINVPVGYVAGYGIRAGLGAEVGSQVVGDSGALEFSSHCNCGGSYRQSERACDTVWVLVYHLVLWTSVSEPWLRWCCDAAPGIVVVVREVFTSREIFIRRWHGMVGQRVVGD